ncbi:MAG: hypothetical protein GF313_03910, partial [Caldithrix sp.]|nr:hypothetical protein [Caldithrix sp.]
METTYINQIWLIAVVLIIAAFVIYYFRSRKAEEERVDQSNYLLALKYIAEGDYRSAIDKLKAVVRQDTENIDAYIKLGDVLRHLKLYNNAIRIHKDLTLRGNIPEKQIRDIWFSLAMDYWLANKMDSAEHYLKKLLPYKQY